SPHRVHVPIELIRTKKKKGAAFTLACDTSDLEDKEIAGVMNIDPGTFSRIKSGTNTLDNDRIDEFNKVVGNRVYSEWLAYLVGCTLVMIQSEAERRAYEAERELAVVRDKAERELEAERAKTKLLLEVLHGKAA
ncbi:MAG: transcriptional regulator, partial [Burkholderiaceae bacterium]